MTHRAAGSILLVFASFALPASAGAAVQQVAGSGSGSGQVTNPTAISVNAAGELVVADGGGGNARVQKLTRSGAHLLSFSVPYASGNGVSEFDTAVGSGDDIYTNIAPAPESGPVSRYTTTGTLVRSWGSAFDAHPLPDASGMAVGGGGEVYVLVSAWSGSDYIHRVVRHTAEGTYSGEWQLGDSNGLPRRPIGIAARGDRVVVALGPTDTHPTELVGYGPGGNELWRSVGQPSSSGQDGRGGALGLTIAPSGEIFAAGGYLVEQFSSTGELLSVYRVPGLYSPPSPPSYDPCVPRPPDPQSIPWPEGYFTGVAVDELGDVYLTDTGRDAVMRMNGVPTAALDWAPRSQSSWYGSPITGETIAFDASRSELPFGSLTKFEWDFDDDGTFELDTGIVPRAKTAFATAGWHEIRMRVTGSRGFSAVRTAKLHVNESQVWMYGSGIGLTGKQVKFHASNSGMQCGESTHDWDLDGDGTFETSTGREPSVTKIFDETGSTFVRVRVTRGAGRIDTAEVLHETRLAPPPGPVGVTINGGAQYTNNSVVRVNPIWPKLTKQLTIANDGGFRKAKSFRIGESQPWRLESSGPERLPKTIYVRFEGASVYKDNQTFTDDIILDETNPVVTQVSMADYRARRATVSRRRFVRLRVRARDNLSGVSQMQVTPKRRRPGRWREVKRLSIVWTGADALWVRVRDKAGNRSRWKLAR